MKRSNLYVYHREAFDEFYEKSSLTKYIYPASFILNSNLEWTESDWDENYYVDITSLYKLVDARQNLMIHCEILIKELLEEDVKVIIDDAYSTQALSLFNLYFSSKEYLTERTGEVEEKKLSKNTKKYLKDVFVYSTDQFLSMKEERNYLNIEVISISDIMQKGNIFDYSIETDRLNKHQIYDIDISSLIKHLKFRSDLMINYEIAINQLCAMENVFFIVNNEVEEDCKNLFRLNFHNYIQLEPSTYTPNISKYKHIIEYSLEDLDVLLIKMDNELFGHNAFKTDLKNQLRTYNVLHKLKQKKLFSIFICGESGIGKTEVARLLHKYLYPNTNQIKINFGNYTGRGSLWSLIGSPKGYYGSGEGGELSNKILKSESRVILIDEFEKADESIYNFFYELLEDGHFTDLMGNEIDLNGYIIVFTSNLTEQTYKDSIPDALLSRFDMRYEFLRLTSQDKRRFIEYKVDQLISDLISNYNIPANATIDRELLLNIDVEHLHNLRDIRNELNSHFIRSLEPILSL